MNLVFQPEFEPDEGIKKGFGLRVPWRKGGLGAIIPMATNRQCMSVIMSDAIYEEALHTVAYSYTIRVNKREA